MTGHPEVTIRLTVLQAFSAIIALLTSALRRGTEGEISVW